MIKGALVTRTKIQNLGNAWIIILRIKSLLSPKQIGSNEEFLNIAFIPCKKLPVRLQVYRREIAETERRCYV